jgi:CrcB protein
MSRGETFRLYIAVGIGAAVGALMRDLVGLVIHVGAGLPSFLGTGTVNVVGSFIIMFVATVSGPDGRLLIGPVRRQAVMTGFCGGLTTFSSMSLDTFFMASGNHPLEAAVYLVTVVALSLAGCWAGYVAAARLNNG